MNQVHIIKHDFMFNNNDMPTMKTHFNRTLIHNCKKFNSSAKYLHFIRLLHV